MGKPKSKPKEQTKTAEEMTTTSSGFHLKKPLFILAILAAIASYYVFKVITTPPEKPKINLEEWWGQYPIDQDKDVSIRPYEIEFSKAMVADLKERLLHTRPFTPPVENSGFSYGFNTHFLNQVMDYWKNKYDFEERERFLNKFNHYVTNIQGMDIHYMHVKPNVPSNVTVVPLLMIHGWPGSVREFYEIIPMLTTYRDNQDFVFEVIAPSLPGFGFSQAPVRSGLGAIETSVVLHNLMVRIGHDSYYIQGGHYGHVVGSIMATYFPENVLGFHTNTPVVFNPLAAAYITLGSLWPGLIVEPELQDRLYPLSKYFSWMLEEQGYLHLQATRPDTIGVALSDSPSGLAAYILEKFSSWTHPDYKKAADGGLLNKFSLTHLLDNVMIYWSSNCITSSMRLYKETFSQPQLHVMDRIPTEVPTWGIKFKHEITFQPDAVLRLKYKNYLHSTAVEEGGHFAAMENPGILSDDVYDAVEMFRAFHSRNKNSPPPLKRSDSKTIYEFTVKDIKGRDVKLDKYKGKVLLIVNVASKCGYTDNHYKQLNQLYEKYEGKGLRILAFPCNQFGGQEPGNFKDILEFTKNRGVKFDLFDKIEVNGDSADPLWKFLKQVKSGTMGDFIKWNFSKFIVDRNGVPVERFGPNVDPLDLVPYLDKYW